MTEFYVKVVPDQEEFQIDTAGTYPVIHLTAPASQGRANSELVSRLSTILDTDVGIISGHQSKRKKLVVDLEEDIIDEKMRRSSHDTGA